MGCRYKESCPSEAASRSESDSCARVHDKTGIGKRKRSRTKARRVDLSGVLLVRVAGVAGRGITNQLAAAARLNGRRVVGRLCKRTTSPKGEVPKNNQVANLVGGAEEKDERSGGRERVR